MYLLWCCGLCDQPIETNTRLENQPEILDELVIIEPFPDVTTLQLAQPSELSEKLALPSVPALILVPTPTDWEVSKKTSPVKKFNATSPFFASAEFGNASEEQIDKHNALDKREIVQLEQRLCDLKTGISSSNRSPEPLSIENENFLKSYRSQITIHTDAGFQDMAEKAGFHTFLQKQKFGLPLTDPTDSCTTSSYVQRPLALNRTIYHPTREPSFSANISLFSENIVKQNADGKLSPVIKIADTETENVENHELNSPNEQTVKSFIEDLLLNL